MTADNPAARRKEIERRIAEIKARLPKHSPRPSMLIEIDELEDELCKLVEGGESADGQRTAESG